MKYTKSQQFCIDLLPSLDVHSLIESVIEMSRDYWDSDKDSRDDKVFDMYKEELSKKLLEAKVISEPLSKADR